MEAVTSNLETSISPVKRLITMYNSNGAAAHKASRRKKKNGPENFETEKTNLADNKRESPSSPESSTVSRESSPRNRNDDCWSSDDCSVDKQDNQSPIKLMTPPKPSDIFRDSSDENEISWEVNKFNRTHCWQFDLS